MAGIAATIVIIAKKAFLMSGKRLIFNHSNGFALHMNAKNKEGKYEQDFGATARFIGHAHNKISEFKAKDLIKLGDCEVTNKYDKEKKTTYTNYAVFDFEPFNGAAAQPTKKDEIDDQDCPF